LLIEGSTASVFSAVPKHGAIVSNAITLATIFAGDLTAVADKFFSVHGPSS
jgi:hypothetical protein